MRVLQYFLGYFLWVCAINSSNVAFETFFNLETDYDVIQIVKRTRQSLKTRNNNFFLAKYKNLKNKNENDFFMAAFAPLEGEMCQDFFAVYIHTPEENIQAFEEVLQEKFRKRLWDIAFETPQRKISHLPLLRENALLATVIKSIEHSSKSMSRKDAISLHETVLKNLCRDENTFMFVAHDQFNKFKGHFSDENYMDDKKDIFEKIPEIFFPALNLWDFIMEIKRTGKYPTIESHLMETSNKNIVVKFLGFYQSQDGKFPLDKNLTFNDVITPTLKRLTLLQRNLKGPYTHKETSFRVLSLLNFEDYQKLITMLQSKLPFLRIFHNMEYNSLEDEFFTIDVPFEPQPFSVNVSLNCLRLMYNFADEFNSKNTAREESKRAIFALPRELTSEQWRELMRVLKVDDGKITSNIDKRTLRKEACLSCKNPSTNIAEPAQKTSPTKSVDEIMADLDSSKKTPKKRSKTQKKNISIQTKPNTAKPTETQAKQPPQSTNIASIDPLPFTVTGNTVVTAGVDDQDPKNPEQWKQVKDKSNQQEMSIARALKKPTDKQPLQSKKDKAEITPQQPALPRVNITPAMKKPASFVTKETSYLEATAPHKARTTKEKPKTTSVNQRVVKKVFDTTKKAMKSHLNDKKVAKKKPFSPKSFSSNIEQTVKNLANNPEEIKAYVDRTTKMFTESRFWADTSWAREREILHHECQRMIGDIHRGNDAYNALYDKWYHAQNILVEREEQVLELQQQLEQKNKEAQKLRKNFDAKKQEAKEHLAKNQELEQENADLKAEIKLLRKQLDEKRKTN